MANCGAVFHAQHRTDDLQGWTYELPAGGDLQRCRQIIKDAKARGGVYWSAFHQAVIEIARGAS